MIVNSRLLYLYRLERGREDFSGIFPLGISVFWLVTFCLWKWSSFPFSAKNNNLWHLASLVITRSHAKNNVVGTIPLSFLYTFMKELSLRLLFYSWKSLRDEVSENFLHTSQEVSGYVGVLEWGLYPSLWDSGVILYQNVSSFSADIHSDKCLDI